MDNKSLSQSVLGRIKEQHIEPRPHWHFMLKNVLFWTVFCLSALIGARAMGVVMFVLSDLRPELVAQNGVHGIPPFMQILPLTWLVFFILTILIAVLGLHHTKKGYRISIHTIILINLALSLLLGGVLFAVGDGERFEKTVSERVPFVPKAELRRQQVWNTPTTGRLAGEILDESVNTASTSISLLDLTGKTWTVNLNGLPLPVGPDGRVLKRIRLVGTQTGDSTFTASAIYPWSNLPPPPRPGMRLNGERLPPQQDQPFLPMMPPGPGQQMMPPPMMQGQQLPPPNSQQPPNGQPQMNQPQQG